MPTRTGRGRPYRPGRLLRPNDLVTLEAVERLLLPALRWPASLGYGRAWMIKEDGR